jgi:hypothetical protein
LFLPLPQQIALVTAAAAAAATTAVFVGLPTGPQRQESARDALFATRTKSSLSWSSLSLLCQLAWSSSALHMPPITKTAVDCYFVPVISAIVFFDVIVYQILLLLCRLFILLHQLCQISILSPVPCAHKNDYLLGKIGKIYMCLG